MVAHGLQNFARRHVLGPVPGGDDLAAWLAVRVRGAVLNEYVVAVTRSGGGTSWQVWAWRTRA